MSFQSRDTVSAIIATLASTHRPRLLLRTARIGLAEYVRETDLRRILRLPATPAPGPATVQALIELEARHEDQRTRPPHEAGDTWRPSRHVEVLIALLAEAQLMAFVPVTPLALCAPAQGVDP